MSILCVEWLCTQERYNPELAIVFGAAARYAGLQLAAALMTRIRVIQRCTRGRFAPTPALWGASSSYRPVRAMAVRKCSKCCQLFRVVRARALFVRGVMHPYYKWARRGRGEALVSYLDGLALMEFHGASSLLGEEDSKSPPRWL
jgi:hypothetical protein